MAPDQALRIGDVARAVGLTVEAVRYYEAEGLLSPERDDSGRRRYREVDVDALRVVTALRGAGFGVREIEQMMTIKRPDDTPVDRLDAGLAVLADLTATIDRRQASLDAARELCETWRFELTAAREGLLGSSG